MSGLAPSAATAAPAAVPSLARAFLRRPAAIVAVAFLGLLVTACVAAPLIAPYAPLDQDLTHVLSGPSGHHLLGTDSLGRDVLSRLLYGGRRSLLAVVEAVVVVLALGVPIGLIAGYAGGWFDWLATRVAEIVQSIPAIVLILVVLAIIPHNEHVAMVTLGILGAPSVLRVVRGAALKVREELYVTAARVSGLSRARIVVRHILPRVKGPIIVQASLFAAYALLFETGLSFLGLTADPATPTWGGMVGEAAGVLLRQSWLLVPTGSTIALTILAFGVLGDAVGDIAADTERLPLTTPRRRSVNAEPVEDGGVAGPGSPLALLSVRNLRVVLDREDAETTIVDNVSFEIAPGETVGLVGESGCGKTVTALAVLRLLPRGMRVAGGRVSLDAREIGEVPDGEFDRLRVSALAYVSQEPQMSLDPAFTVRSQLSEVIRRHDRVSRAAARARALELLRLVRLAEPERVASAHAHELSGGMAQRVAIALALAGRPRLLIADEPTTALDVTVQAEILQLLGELQQERGMSILLITHNWGVVADLCDRAIVMYAGQVIEQASVEALFAQPLHPYTLGLLDSHPSRGEPGEALRAMPGRVPAPEAWPAGCRFAPRCALATDACRAGPIAMRQVRQQRLSRCVHAEQLTEQEATIAP